MKYEINNLDELENFLNSQYKKYSFLSRYDNEENAICYNSSQLEKCLAIHKSTKSSTTLFFMVVTNFKNQDVSLRIESCKYNSNIDNIEPFSFETTEA